MSMNRPTLGVSCMWCGEVCADNEIVTVVLDGVTYQVCPFCSQFASWTDVQTAYSYILQWEWLTDHVDYI